MADGGAGADTLSVLVTAGRIDLGAELAAFAGNGAVGAVATFSGYCRDEEGRLAGLELEHYPGMAEREILSAAREAAARWPILACRAVHRFGLVRAGEEIVFLACASAHREAAFAGASFLMDFLKTRAPFWKREHFADGTLGGWVAAKAEDAAAAERWRQR